MTHFHAFYINSYSALEPGTNWTLGEDEIEAQKHIKALRLKVDENFFVINGDGNLYQSRLVSTNPYVLESVRTIKGPSFRKRFDLFLSPPNNSDLEKTIYHCVELGIQNIHLFQSQHCTNSNINQPRLKRIIHSACEQSLNPSPPDLHNHTTGLENMISDFDLDSANTAFFDETEKESTPSSTGGFDKILIGPEGGWSEEERGLIKSKNIASLSLGPLILKVPTAVVSAANFLRYKELENA